jgi:hypothetical protein
MQPGLLWWCSRRPWNRPCGGFLPNGSKLVIASYYGMSSETDGYRIPARECCLKATIAEDVERERRSHWLEAAARWLSFGRQEGATLSEQPAGQVERSLGHPCVR